ncbi:MAG: hypothetical protein GF308_21345 [Candidatus Heimdallarchaeota archaeon]|nr:hypothetical protein [Candidatus Heimdallarchaeota archaeon]
MTLERQKKLAIEYYNKGVKCFNEAEQLTRAGTEFSTRRQLYKDAHSFFGKCFQLGFYEWQAAYAQCLCDSNLNRDCMIPIELKGKEDASYMTFLAANLACYLIKDGYMAIVETASEKPRISAWLKEKQYEIEMRLVFGGNFSYYIRRIEGSNKKTIFPSADDSSAVTKEEKYLQGLVLNVNSLQISPIPISGKLYRRESDYLSETKRLVLATFEESGTLDVYEPEKPTTSQKIETDEPEKQRSLKDIIWTIFTIIAIIAVLIPIVSLVVWIILQTFT